MPLDVAEPIVASVTTVETGMYLVLPSEVVGVMLAVASSVSVPVDKIPAVSIVATPVAVATPVIVTLPDGVIVQ